MLDSAYDITDGDWYWEIEFITVRNRSGTSAGLVDPANLPPSGIVGFAPLSAGLFADGLSRYDGSSANSIGGYAGGSSLRFRFNADSREFYMAVGNSNLTLHSTVEPNIVYSPSIHTAGILDIRIRVNNFLYSVPNGSQPLSNIIT